MPEKIEYFFNEGWTMVSLDGTEVSAEELDDYDKMRELTGEAAAEESARLLKEKVTVAEQQNIQLAQAKKEADAAKQEALAADEAKGIFLSHMSHEIRTPINAVLGMDEMLLRESAEPQY